MTVAGFEPATSVAWTGPITRREKINLVTREQRETEETKDRFTEWVVDVIRGEVRQIFRTGVPLMCTI